MYVDAQDVVITANAVVCMVLFALLVMYGLDMKVPYPRKIVQAFDEPYIRVLTYFAVYYVAYYNPIISVLLFMCVMLLHIDYINLITNK